MTVTEKISFLSEKIKELIRITGEIENEFPEKSFKLDGILIGNIVEVMAAHAYGISLYKQSEKMHDGEVNGKKVQIKGTQKTDSIVIREKPEYLLVEYLDKENGTIQEIYNGPGKIAWEYRSFAPSMNSYTIRVNKLLELDATIPDEHRIKQVIGVEKFNKKIIYRDDENDINVGDGKQSGKKRKTLVSGYVNRNNQENLGCLNKPGNHWNQMAYGMRCNVCGFKYEANG